MEHSFNIKLAEDYGIEEAILINHLFYWIKKNVVNDKHFYDGRYWTYNSIKAFSALFSYMKPKTISRCLDNLIEKGIILKGNYNQSAYDRTCWYAFSDYGISILHNEKMDLLKLGNGDTKIGEPIPYNNTDNKKDNNIISQQVEELYKLYPSKCPKRNVSLGKSFKDKERLLKLIRKNSYEMLKFTIEKEIEEKYGKSYMLNFSTFLNNLPDYGYGKEQDKEGEKEDDRLIINGIEYK